MREDTVWNEECPNKSRCSNFNSAAGCNGCNAEKEHLFASWINRDEIFDGSRTSTCSHCKIRVTKEIERCPSCNAVMVSDELISGTNWKEFDF